jgi:hypothetical protein
MEEGRDESDAHQKHDGWRRRGIDEEAQIDAKQR